MKNNQRTHTEKDEWERATITTREEDGEEILL